MQRRTEDALDIFGDQLPDPNQEPKDTEAQTVPTDVQILLASSGDSSDSDPGSIQGHVSNSAKATQITHTSFWSLTAFRPWRSS